MSNQRCLRGSPESFIANCGIVRLDAENDKKNRQGVVPGEKKFKIQDPLMIIGLALSLWRPTQS